MISLKRLRVMSNSDIEFGGRCCFFETTFLACGSLDFCRSRVIVAPRGQVGFLRNQIYY